MAVQKLSKQGTEEAQEPLLDKETGPHEVVHPLPLRLVTDNWTLGRSFYDSAKFGIVQYVSFILDSECLVSRFFGLVT